MDSRFVNSTLNTSKNNFVPRKQANIREFGSPRFTRKKNDTIL